jgi:hypothetical protein
VRKRPEGPGRPARGRDRPEPRRRGRANRRRHPRPTRRRRPDESRHGNGRRPPPWTASPKALASPCPPRRPSSSPSTSSPPSTLPPATPTVPRWTPYRLHSVAVHQLGDVVAGRCLFAVAPAFDVGVVETPRAVAPEQAVRLPPRRVCFSWLVMRVSVRGWQLDVVRGSSTCSYRQSCSGWPWRSSPCQRTSAHIAGSASGVAVPRALLR